MALIKKIPDGDYNPSDWLFMVHKQYTTVLEQVIVSANTRPLCLSEGQVEGHTVAGVDPETWFIVLQGQPVSLGKSAIAKSTFHVSATLITSCAHAQHPVK
jgi:hypothetical protein